MENFDGIATGKGVLFTANGVFSRIILMLTSFGISTNHYNDTNTSRDAAVMIMSKQTDQSVEMTLSELQQFLDKFEEQQFDGEWSHRDCQTPAPGEPMKLFKFQCGECFVLEYHSSRVRIDRDIFHKLLTYEEKMKSFLEFDDDAAFTGDTLSEWKEE